MPFIEGIQIFIEGVFLLQCFTIFSKLEKLGKKILTEKMNDKFQKIYNVVIIVLKLRE